MSCARYCYVCPYGCDGDLAAMAGLFAVSDTAMSVMGPKWVLASGVLEILSLLGMFTLFTIFTGPLLQALSRPHHLAVLEWSRTIIGSTILLVAGLWVRQSAVQTQVDAIALARFATGVLVVTPVFGYLLVRLGRISIRELLASIAPSFMAAVAVEVSVFLLSWSRILSDSRSVIELSGAVGTGGACGLPRSLSSTSNCGPRSSICCSAAWEAW